MNESTPHEKNETMLGLYALTANKTAKPDNCPSDENMAAFIDQQLSGKDRKAILKHLNHCPVCYKDWIASCEAIEVLEPSRQTHQSWWEKRWQEINNYRQLWNFGIPAAAFSAMIVLLVIFPFSNNIKDQINNLYSQSIAQSENYAMVVEKMSLPWEKTTLGFNLTGLSPATKAFGAGLWEGRTELLKSKDQPLPEELVFLEDTPWSDSNWSAHYFFGRWTVLLWTALESNQEIINWQDYKSIQIKLFAILSKHPVTDYDAHQAVLSLNKIAPLLVKTEQSNDQANIRKLAHELKLTMYKLGPDHL